jgi:hypothetical protein
VIWDIVIAALSGTVATAIAVAWGLGQQGHFEKQLGMNKLLQAELNAAYDALRASEAGRKTETERLEALVVALKAEVASLEADVAACADPAVVRARLRKLLSSGLVPPDSDATPASGTPAQPVPGKSPA